MKRFYGRILICLIPTLVSLGVVGWAYNEYINGRGGFILGVDLAGGTILVYEVDTSKTTDRVKPDELAAALKRRIDPNDLYNITIRPIGESRVEIVLPTGGKNQIDAENRAWANVLKEFAKEYPVEGQDDPYGKIKRGNVSGLIDAIVAGGHDRNDVSKAVDTRLGRDRGGRKMLSADEVEVIKGLIARQGRLEFLILANSNDDAAALQAASAAVTKLTKADREKLEVRGEPPAPPAREDGSKTFTVNSGGTAHEHTYRWVELGKPYLYSLKLNSADRASARINGQPADREVPALAESGRTFEMGNNLYFVRKINTYNRVDKKDRDLGKEYEFFVLARESLRGEEVTGDFIVRAAPGLSEKGGRSIDFGFSAEGGRRFFAVTSRNVNRQLAIAFDGQIVSAPNLNSAISTSGQITGTFTEAEVNDTVRILRAGALPATLKKNPVSENSMGATLGAETIFAGSLSVLAAFVAVLAFMIFYYRFAGFVACVALFANLLFTVAFMVAVQAAFTLPGLAGLVLTLGMAVDANVLIYERLREEREKKADLKTALREGYERALPTILDTHLSSIFTAIVLYVVGNDQLKGFGISLAVGLVISLFTSLYMTRLMFDIWFDRGWLKDLGFFSGLADLIHSKYWDFMSIRWYWLTATAILTVLGGALFIYRLDKTPSVLNIDFTGGVAFTGQMEKKMSLGQVRAELAPVDEGVLPDLSIDQIFTAADEGAPELEGGSGPKGRMFTIRTSNRNPEQVLEYIREKLGGKLKLTTLRAATAVKDAGGKTASKAELVFADKDGNADFASRSQVQRLLAEQLGTATFGLEPSPKAEEKDEHFSALTVTLSEPMEATEFEKALAGLTSQFNSKPQPERLEVFDTQLAKSTQQRALYAILASWAAILLFLWFRFGNWTFGAAAVVCLIHDLFFTLGIIAACHYVHHWFGPVLGIQDFKIDLPAVAALLTLVGYSVNDTIVVFDRIREVRGKSPLLTDKMLNDSINQTLTRTILASATVMLVVLVLYLFGGEGIKLFAFVMIIGVFVGTYSSIYIAAPLLQIFGEGKIDGVTADRTPVKAATE